MAKKKSRATIGSADTGVGVRDLRGWVESVLAELPGAELQWKFHNVSLTVHGKVFAFTKGAGIAIKLPAARVNQLVKDGTATVLVMGTRSMREWAVVPRSEVGADFETLREAQNFVASLIPRHADDASGCAGEN
jgi:hypothetical protein